MRFGFVLPGGGLRDQVELAVLAEESGWDGVFTWEGIGGYDPWGLMCAMAQRTARVRLGPMLTPLPWRRPWTVASQAATLDQLSDGRAVLTVGLGAPEVMPAGSGDAVDRRERAALLDEGIDVVTALHAGRTHDGERWKGLAMREDFLAMARPVQSPRVPIWVPGAWPRPRSMERVLRCDGIVVDRLDPDGTRERPSPDDVRAIRGWLAERGAPEAFDVVVDGETPADDEATATQEVAGYAEAGATWWLETRWAMPEDGPERKGQVRERLAAGPPRVARA